MGTRPYEKETAELGVARTKEMPRLEGLVGESKGGLATADLDDEPQRPAASMADEPDAGGGGHRWP